jgi:hypothetical protein
LHDKGCIDRDRDGICDDAEYELARRAAPVLKFPAREALLDRMRTLWQVHNAGRDEVVITYVQTYVADIGAEKDGHVQADHPGDTETVRYWLHSRDGGHTFKLVRAHYHHHTNGQDWAAGEPGLETEHVNGEDHPVVWVQWHAHGSYLDQKHCSDDPEGDGDKCEPGFVALAAIDPRANAGEADAPLLDEQQMAMFGFPGESAWNERHNAFGVRGFCGGLPEAGVFGGVAHVGANDVNYRRRVVAAVCAGPLAIQWDRKPRGTEDIIYWQGLHSQRIGNVHGRPAVGADGTIYVRDGQRLLANGREIARASGDPAAAGNLVAYANAGRVVVRTPDGKEHATPIGDPEVALAQVAQRLYVVARGTYTFSDDGGLTFAPAQHTPMNTTERPAAASWNGKLLLAWRTPAHALEARLLDEQSPRRLAEQADAAPWAAASGWDHGAVYVFTARKKNLLYYKVGADTVGPVEVPGATVGAGGAAAAQQAERILLAHDGPDGLYVRLFDPNLF